MDDKKIIVQFGILKDIETIGHQKPDGWWYIYLPQDNDWHHVPNTDVKVIN